MMDLLEIFAPGIRPTKSSLSVILDSGGESAMLVDIAEDQGLAFAALTPVTISRLDQVLEPEVETTNPLDAFGTGNYLEEVYRESILAFDSDPNTGLTALCVDLITGSDKPPNYGSISVSLIDQLKKPLVVLTNVSASASKAQSSEFRQAGIPVLMGTETGLCAINHLFAYTDHQRCLKELTESSSPPNLDQLPSQEIVAEIREQLLAADQALDEVESKQILRAYGINTTVEILVNSLAETVQAAEEIGYPIVLKTAAGALHKTEQGGYLFSVEKQI